MIKKVFFKNKDEIKNALKNNCVVHAIPKINIDDPDSFYFDLIGHIGKPFFSEEDFESKNKTGSLWSDIKYIKEKSSSFSFSNTRQPFHTDGAYEKEAPDISFFYCIKSAQFGGSTIFAETELLLDCLNFYDKKIFDGIQNNLIRHFKGNDEKLLPILKNKKWNWNYFRAEKSDLVEKFYCFLENIIYKSGMYQSVYLKERECLLFWDKKVLHGRNAFLGDRHLRKAGIYV